MSLAPLVADGKVMVGASGGELGVRGFVAAFDAETGKELWRTYTVPAPGEPGSETWPKGDQWKTGGGSVWVTGIYDPETNLAFWGTGNGGPWMGDQRPGDNLYTSSTIALDVATGTDQGPLTSTTRTIRGTGTKCRRRSSSTTSATADDQRPGRRRARRLSLVPRAHRRTRSTSSTAQPYVKQNVFTSLDPKTGRPSRSASTSRAPARRRISARRLWGGKNWPPIAFSPKTRLIYIPANENLCGAIIGRAGRPTSPGQRLHRRDRAGCYVAPGRRSHRRSAGLERRHRQEGVDAQLSASSQNWGPMLATGGGLRVRAAAPTTASSARSMRRPASCCGSSRPASGIIGAAVVVPGRRQAVHRRAVAAGASTRRACRRG